jgi:uncharacterized membrane protein YGL010W
MKDPDKVSSVRLVDKYFDKYSESHQNDTNELIHWICVPLILFSIFGLIWSIPFPHLVFLGKLNGSFNWGSFMIAFLVYYYYKLSPVLSYAMLLVLLIFTGAVVGLEEWYAAGGLPLWETCLIIFILAWVGQFIGHKIEGKKPSFLDDVRFLLIGPIWLLHFLFKKAGVKY